MQQGQRVMSPTDRRKKKGKRERQVNGFRRNIVVEPQGLKVEWGQQTTVIHMQIRDIHTVSGHNLLLLTVLGLALATSSNTTKAYTSLAYTTFLKYGGSNLWYNELYSLFFSLNDIPEQRKLVNPIIGNSTGSENSLLDMIPFTAILLDHIQRSSITSTCVCVMWWMFGGMHQYCVRNVADQLSLCVALTCSHYNANK